MTKERTKQLLYAIFNVLENKRLWVESDQTYITRDFEVSVDELIVTYREGEIPQSIKQMLPLVVVVKDGWTAWKERIADRVDPQEMPAMEFWAALEQLEQIHDDITNTRPPVRIETIEELEKQKVNRQQICTIYGWVDSDGTPQYHMIDEEKAEPGTHLGESYRSPGDRRRELEDQRRKDGIKAINDRVKEKVLLSQQTCPESLVELIEQGVSIAQIKEMKRVSEEEVISEAQRNNLPVPQKEYSVRHLTGLHDQEPSETRQRVLDSIGSEPADAYPGEAETNFGEGPETIEVVSDESVESQIIRMHLADEGTKNSSIAKALSTEDHPVSVQRVNGVLRRYKKDPSQFFIEAE